MILFIYMLGMVLHYGFLFAYWQGRWPSMAEETYTDDIITAAFSSLVWPIIVLTAITERKNIYKYGLKFW